MSMVVPVSSVMERIVTPPLPMTSRILSGWIRRGNDPRSVLGHLLPRPIDHLGHLVEDVKPTFLGLRERPFHDFAGNAVDLDVHLEGGDPGSGPRDLEIHVAEVVLVAEDVGEDHAVLALFDQPHGDSGHRRLDGNSRIHEGEAAAAHRGHRARPVGLGYFGHHADDVGKLLHVRHHRLHPTLGEATVADFPALG